MRVLIATVTAGAGHLQAAAAIEEAWRSLRPGDEVQRLDLLDFVPGLQRKLYVQGYVKFVEHAPELWGMVFKKTDDPALVRKVAGIRRALARASNNRFTKHLKSFRPEVIVGTHFQPIEVVGHLKTRLADWHPFTASVVTDFEAHALWMEPAVDLYCVAAEETRNSLCARGVDPAHVAVTGIPVAARFSGPLNPRAIRKTLGLRDDLPVALVLSGGFGMGPVAEILAAFDGIQKPLQAVVVAGRNESLRRELSIRDFKHPTKILGFVSNMQELMAVADLIVTKPGGLTTSEALALGRPLMILNPIPGQEAANSDFLLERGAAAKVNRVEDLPSRLDQLLGSKKLKDMARAAKTLGKPSAALDVCHAVLHRMPGN